MVIFHSYVKLPEGMKLKLKKRVCFSGSHEFGSYDYVSVYKDAS